MGGNYMKRRIEPVKNGIYESQDHYLNCANIMLKHGLISGQEYQVYMALAQSLRDDLTPCLEVMCCMTSLSYGDVEEAIQGLVEAHMLEIEAHGDKRTYKIRA